MEATCILFLMSVENARGGLGGSIISARLMLILLPQVLGGPLVADLPGRVPLTGFGCRLSHSAWRGFGSHSSLYYLVAIIPATAAIDT